MRQRKYENKKMKTDKTKEKQLKRIVDKYKGKTGMLISILQDIQSAYGCFSKRVLRYICQELNLSLTDVYEIATALNDSRLKPKGQHLVKVCLCPSCYIRGGKYVVDAIERYLGIKSGETTPDNQFAFETVNSLKCCAKGPMVVINGQYYSQITPLKITFLLKKFSRMYQKPKAISLCYAQKAK